MFAMLPDKRTVEDSSSISFITAPKDDDNKDPSWQTFELTDCNLNNALALLDKAYRQSMLHPFSDDPSLHKSVCSSGWLEK